jgi:DNA repair protein RecN (Recombination protein N)
MLDRFAGIDLSSYQKTFNHYQQMQQRIRDLKQQMTQVDQQIAQLTELADEISKLNPKSGELTEIENEIAKLGSVEVLNQALSTALNLFENEDVSAINLLQQIQKSLDQVVGKDKKLDEISDRYTENLLNLQDISSDLTSYLSQLEADPIRFEKLQERKAALNSLLKRYGKGSDRDTAFEQLIQDGKSAKDQIADLSGGEERIAQLEQEAQAIFKQLKQQAEEISNLRKINSNKLAKQVTEEIRNLSMPNASFVIDQKIADLEDARSFTSTGVDEISILFSAHAGGNPLALNKVASGGELSRVMLALEVVIAEAEPVGTYIFDEVDAGVGGKAAVEVGRRLSKLSKSAQVIVVTHLAQVAAWADNHLVVRKNENGMVTQSDVIEVSDQERKVEIARMLSGQEDSQTAQEHAGELLAIVRNA